MNRVRRVGLPWQALTRFARVGTDPRALELPLTPDEAITCVEAWLAALAAWIPRPTDANADVSGSLVRRHGVTSDLVSDARLVALALEHGLTMCSADTDFARFPEIAWLNPLV